MTDDKRDGTHYAGCDKVHPQCGDARLAEIKERRGNIAKGEWNASGNGVHNGMYCVAITEPGEASRDRAKSHANASFIASAPADIDHLFLVLEQKDAELERARAALGEINDIRNSIIGLQTVNWSEHVYPLVAALEEAGVEGMAYPAAFEYFGTMLERTNKAEADNAKLREACKKALTCASLDSSVRGFINSALTSKEAGEK